MKYNNVFHCCAVSVNLLRILEISIASVTLNNFHMVLEGGTFEFSYIFKMKFVLPLIYYNI